MARIRSVHPALFTDEAFIQLSDAAQIFWIGLWTEADDQGVFEWKPATLKLRLRGASTAPVEPLLAELIALDCIRRYEIEGRQYAAIRNFQRFQRPKKPNSIHVLPPEFRTYVGSSGPSSEPEEDIEPSSSPPATVKPPSVPPKSEKPPQMEDGGGKEREALPPRNARASPANGAGPPRWLDRRIVPASTMDAVGADADRPLCNGMFVDYAVERIADATMIEVIPLHDKTLLGWLADGYYADDIVDIIRPIVERAGPGKPLKYFDKAVREHSPACKPLHEIAPEEAEHNRSYIAGLLSRTGTKP